MNGILRQSPLHFEALPLASENRDGWEVVLEYERETHDEMTAGAGATAS